MLPAVIRFMLFDSTKFIIITKFESNQVRSGSDNILKI